ncbi:MAG: AAA family ATPase [bacterium]|nr:AAA family ATPase [bacterium]
MKINYLKISHIKSINDEIEIKFNKDINILIGPNASGKSNILDIINFIMYGDFIKKYEIKKPSGYEKQINHLTLFDLNKELNSYAYIDDNKREYEIELLMEESDWNNMRLIQREMMKIVENKKVILPINKNTFNSWHFPHVTNENEMRFSWKNNNKKDLKNKNYITQVREYLKNYLVYQLLFKENEIEQLKPIYLYFSPYRMNINNNLITELYKYNYDEELFKCININSKQNNCFLPFASSYFSDRASFYKNIKLNYKDEFQNDAEVIFLKELLKLINMDFEPKLVNHRTQKYEIEIIKNSKRILLSDLSSGEKEILNFIFGLSTLNIKDGVILIDEPDLHLHPQWHSRLMEILNIFSQKRNVQLITATHSKDFINNNTIKNIFRIYIDNNSSKIAFVNNWDNLSNKDTNQIINTIGIRDTFFVDKVIMVEGIKDEIVFSKALERFIVENDYKEEIKILRIDGKKNFNKFRLFFENYKIENYIIADQDYIRDLEPSSMRLFDENKKKIVNNIKDPKSLDGQDLFSKIKEQYSKNIFILKNGEIEDYLPGEFKKSMEKVIEFINDEDEFKKWYEDQDEIKVIISNIINYKKRG